jgi:hypothetical protein
MYAAMYIDGKILLQTGDHNNKSFVAKLKKTIAAAIARGAKVEISSPFVPVKSS